MNYDKFTEKSREALGEAQQMAAKMNHQELTGLHLLAALLKQTEGPVCSMMTRMNVDLKALNNEIDEELNRINQVTGDAGQVYLGQEGTQILQEGIRQTAEGRLHQRGPSAHRHDGQRPCRETSA